MILSYIKIAFRGFRKNRLITFINIFGLGLSMSIGMMVMIRLQDELRYDNFHPAPDRTYRIISNYKKNTGEQWKLSTTAIPLKDQLERDISSAESAVSIYPAFNGKMKADSKEIYINGAFTQPAFFTVFGFTLQSGNASAALEAPNTVILSKSTAERYFGTANPVGKTLVTESGQNFLVTGVLNEPPVKSHIRFDAFASFASVAGMEKNKSLGEKLNDPYAFNAASTYVLLKNGYTASSFQSGLNGLASGLNKNNTNGKVSFTTEAIGKITPGDGWPKFYFEIGAALLILLAACFNYTNLTIARALTRAKEVGVRKINGAKRSQVFTQYIVESVLTCSLAWVFSWIILSFIVRYAPFNDDYEYIPSSFRYNGPLFIGSVAFALLTALLAGISPAWIISAFSPLRVLKNLTTARIIGKVSIQKALIVFQYSLSLTIIIFLLAFYKQFSFMAAADPGYKRDNVLVAPLNGLDSRVAIQKLLSISGVQTVGATSASFAKHFSGGKTISWINDRKNACDLTYSYADPAFIRMMKFGLLAGNNFSDVGDKEKERYILINAQAATALGFTDFQQAVGQQLWVNDSTKLEIAGVLKDFNFENPGIPVRPFAFRSNNAAYEYLYIQSDQADNKIVVQRVNESLKELVPAQSFSSYLFEKELANNNSQAATISLLGYFGFIAVSIASLGLLGLVTYTVQTRRKEISIRKIVGATEKQLVGILSKGFIKLLVIAGLIAIPIGYTAGILFLQNFAIRSSFGIAGALGCFLFLLLLGGFTIISQTYRASIQNPVKELRME